MYDELHLLSAIVLFVSDRMHCFTCCRRKELWDCFPYIEEGPVHHVLKELERKHLVRVNVIGN